MRQLPIRITLLLFLSSPFITNASEWQWSVKITSQVSGETNDHPVAFLWIPSSCEKVKGVVVGCHNMLEEPIFEHPVFRNAMEELGFAEIWITPGIDPLFDLSKGSQEAFDEMFASLAEISGYEELKSVPVVPIGHSAYASYPWNYAAFNPQRTLAVLSIKGDSPRTHLTGCGRQNVDWGNRMIEGIPGLIVMGEYEWWTDRLITAFNYRREFPDAPVSVLADAGRGHFDTSDQLIDYLALFIHKAADRINGSGKLKPVVASDGWLLPCWEPDASPAFNAAPYQEYKGNKEEAFWYFDKEMAETTEMIYAKARGKREQFIGHARIQPVFIPEEDGVTFHLSATFTDSLRKDVIKEYAVTPIHINRICGPVEKVNDTTFTVRFYRMGMNNKKRTGDIWLLAENEGDEQYKSTVQQLNLRIPFRNEEGIEQTVDFPSITDVKKGVESILLQAKASSGLRVYYYVKEGPAKVCGDTLYFTDIPPKSKYPIKVTVVAWQYGRTNEPKVQTAEAVERSFYIR